MQTSDTEQQTSEQLGLHKWHSTNPAQYNQACNHLHQAHTASVKHPRLEHRKKKCFQLHLSTNNYYSRHCHVPQLGQFSSGIHPSPGLPKDTFPGCMRLENGWYEQQTLQHCFPTMNTTSVIIISHPVYTLKLYRAFQTMFFWLLLWSLW